MNDSTEATHYQIELTSRQVLAALVVMLVCLFAAFFSGVWIGRNAEADSAAHHLARVDEVSRGGERFDFFSKTGKPQADGEGSAGAAGDETPPDESELPSSPGVPAIDQGDFGPDANDAELDAPEGDRASMTGADPDALFEGDDAAAPTGDELAPPEEMGRAGRRRRAAEQAPEETSIAAAEGEPAVASESQAASAGTPTTAADAAAVAAANRAKATPAGAANPAAAESGVHIQVLATSDRDKAEALVARLVDADFKAYIAPSNEGGRTVYRVRVGPFDDRTIAAGKAEELKSRWGLDSWISPGAP